MVEALRAPIAIHRMRSRMTVDGGERLRSSRGPVEIRVEFRHLGRPHESRTELSCNLGAGEVFVETSVALEVGTEVALAVSPGPGTRPIKLRAQVVRVEEEPVKTGSRVTRRTQGMALRFLDCDPSEFARLTSLAHHLALESVDEHRRQAVP